MRPISSKSKVYLALSIAMVDKLSDVVVDHLGGLIVTVVDGVFNIKGLGVLGFEGQVGASHHFERKGDFEDLLFLDLLLDEGLGRF